MGLFRSNYAKPGPGVDKDAPKKKGIFLFLELLKRKFFKLIQVNLLYVLCSIPYIVLMFLLLTIILNNSMQSFLEGTEIDSGSLLTIYSFFTMIILSLWGSGPASAGLAYVTRCFTREEHSWIMSDFFKKLKENFKQSMILVVIDFAMLFLSINAITQYYMLYINSSNILWLLLLYVSCIIFIIYTFLHFYVYQIMITFDCNYKKLLKISVLLALGKAPMNLFLTLFVFGVMFVIYNFVPGIATMLCIFIIVGLVRFPIEFYSTRTLSRISVELRGDNQ